MELSEDDYYFLCDLLKTETGIELDREKKYFFEARIKPYVKEYGEGSMDNLVELLRADRVVGLRAQIVEALAIHETYFFRDPVIYDTLRDSVIPKLIQKRKDVRKLNIWCPACSSGEDPYSVCMLLRDSFPALADWEIHFVASDFSRPILKKAMAGRYSISQINRGLSAKHLLAWFEQHGLEWGVKDEIRRMVDFREINLIKEWPSLPQFDLVMLRNVMIYFNNDVRGLILRRMVQNMADDGYLVMGATETVGSFKGLVNAIPSPFRPCYTPAAKEVRV